MATRKPYVGGNWKMNLHHAQATALAEAVGQKVTDDSVEVAVFPALPYLAAVADVLCKANNTHVKVGAQDAWPKANGAYTGEVSLSMVQDVGGKTVLIGHSERRHVLGESDMLINEKVLATLEAGLEVVLCLGETLEQREAGQTHDVNRAQLAYGLAGVKTPDLARVTLAYEPVWAIGTGKTATPDDAQDAHKQIRAALGFMHGQDAADAVRIQYGGSMKPGNAADLLAQPDIDGGLIGGASLKPDDFAAIIQAAAG